MQLTDGCVHSCQPLRMRHTHFVRIRIQTHQTCWSCCFSVLGVRYSTTHNELVSVNTCFWNCHSFHRMFFFPFVWNVPCSMRVCSTSSSSSLCVLVFVYAIHVDSKFTMPQSQCTFIDRNANSKSNEWLNFVFNWHIFRMVYLAQDPFDG